MSSLNHPRILIVDDTPANIDILRQYLDQEGYRLSVAISGKKALQLIDKTKPDLILLDIMMPDLSGFEVCRLLKDMPENQDIPVIFLTALSDQKDKVKGFELGAVDYITKPLAHKEVLARVNIHLKIREHASQLEKSNRDHELALYRAEAVNRAKNSFFANMNHELRTPLNAIIGYADLLQEDAEDSGFKEVVSDLDCIKTAAAQLLQILSDMLDIARIEADKIKLNENLVDIDHLFEHIASIMKPLAQKQGNQFIIQRTGHLKKLYTDEIKLQQILLNLLNNANKFTHQGKISIEIDQDEQDVFFYIRDTGIGIPAEKLESIFTAFSQADTSSTRQYGGTGVGLTICQHFCQAMGGDLSVESTLNISSQFTVRLPLEK